MEIELKEIEKCKYNVVYHGSGSEVVNKRMEVLKAFKNAPVPGFRKGKASLDAIRMNYKNQIEASLKNALVETAFHNTLFEKQLKPHGPPTFNSFLYLGKDEYKCEFQMYTKPAFEMQSFRGVDVPKPHQQESVEALSEKILQEFRIKFGTTEVFEEQAQVEKGDNILVNYEGFINNTKVDSLSSDGEMLTVGRSSLSEFDDNIIGMRVGETRVFEIKVGDAALEEFANQVVQFKVTLTGGSKVTPAPLDDSLAKGVGKENLSQLREIVTGNAMNRISQREKEVLSKNISNVLVDMNQIEVPEWMALSEAQYLAHHSKLNWVELSDRDKDKYMEMSRRNVKLSLILEKIRETEPEAQISDNQVFEIIKSNIKDSKKIEEMNKSGYLQILFARIKDEHTLDFVAKCVKLVE